MSNLFKENIAKTLKKNIDLPDQEIFDLIEIPKDKSMGDYAIPCFKFSRILRKNPKIIAEELQALFKDNELFENVAAVNGFLNFQVNNIAFIRDRIQQKIALKENIGNSTAGKNKTVIVEYSSPNIAKPFGVGHLRSTVIGNAIANLYETAGYDVIRINHLGDWGTQFGKLITAYKRWGDEEQLKSDPIRHLYDIYVRFHKEAENDPALEPQARNWFKLLEEGNPEAKDIWNRFKELSLKEFQRIYKRLGVTFDHYTGEAFYSDQLESCIQKIVETGITEESQGALIVNLSEYKMPPCLLRKSDGATLYATRDLSAALYRKNKYQFDKNIYVVGTAQSLHFKQIFKVLELMGETWARDCYHVGFGMILGISTRKGTLVFLEDLLDEAKERAKKIIREKKENFEHLDETADKIAISAIIFQDLSNRRIKDFEFDFERMISFDGDTGPYIQYTLVRINSILSKIYEQMSLEPSIEHIYNLIEQTEPDWKEINNEEALSLIKLADQFDNYIKNALEQHEPAILTNYVLDIAKHFNKFYHSNRVILSQGEVSYSRLTLITIIYHILNKGIKILGMHPIKKM